MNAQDTKEKLEIEKLIEEVVSLRQKNGFFFAGVIFAAVGVAVAVTKLFL